MLVAALWACRGERPDPASAAAVSRVSVALRGVRPTAEELDELEAHPERLDARIDAWLADTGFGDTVRDLHAEVWFLRPEWLMWPAVGPLEGEDLNAIDTSRQEAPLRLVERVVTSGRPYTEIVTSPRTLTDARLAVMEGMAFDPAGPEWQWSVHGDGRPEAGILSTTGFLARWTTNGSGKHRSRANAISRALLCDEIGAHDLPTFPTIDQGDDLALATELREDPACAGCHRDLDPLAAYFWGYSYLTATTTVAGRVEGSGTGYPTSMWHPEDVGRYEEYGLPGPGYYGEAAGSDVGALAQAIVADPRFARCAVTQAWRFLAQQPNGEAPPELLERLTARFVLGWDYRGMVRELVTSDAFLALPALQLRPEARARDLDALTGFRWTIADPELGEVDVLGDSNAGARDLAGGIDHVDLLEPNFHPSPTNLVAWDAAARLAADHAVAQGLVLDPQLEDPAAVRAQLAEWLRRAWGERHDADDPVVDSLYTLFEAARADRTVPEAWALVLRAILQDPAALTY